MENKETAGYLLNLIQRVALHFKIDGAEALGFKKRSRLLEKLKEVSEPAWRATDAVIETRLHVDRILADKEKQLKNPGVWNAELEGAKTKSAEAVERLIAFFKDQGISSDGLGSGI